uniref:Ovule protein n=1 Tax=Panagrellus redivivus TaxID=6233 RepID=A0A7E4VMI2_PANRE
MINHKNLNIPCSSASDLPNPSKQFLQYPSNFASFPSTTIVIQIRLYLHPSPLPSVQNRNQTIDHLSRRRSQPKVDCSSTKHAKLSCAIVNQLMELD